DFFHITKILKNTENGQYVLRGHELQRTRDLNGFLPKKLNELCWKFEVDLDDERRILDQSIVEKNLDEVVRVRQIQVTNQTFPAATFRDAGGWCDRRVIENEAPCTARWKFCSVYRTGADRIFDISRWYERSVECLTAEDIFENRPESFIARNNDVRRLYRGETI